MFYLLVDEQLKLRDKNMKIRIGEKMMMDATRKVQAKLNDSHQKMREEVRLTTQVNHHNN